MRTEVCVGLVVSTLVGAFGCSRSQCQFEEREYELTIGDPYVGPAAPTAAVPSCGPLGDTEPGQTYLFNATSVRDRPSCFADGTISGVSIRDAVDTALPYQKPLLNTQERAPLEFIVTLPSGCRGVWAVDIGIDSEGAAYFGRTFSPVSGPCPDIPPRTGALPRCVDFYTATLAPR